MRKFALLALLSLAPILIANNHKNLYPALNPYQTVTYQSWKGPYSTYLPQFDPALGSLVSASVQTSAHVTYQVSIADTSQGTQDYEIKRIFYIYYTALNYSFTVPVVGKGTLDLSQPVQNIYASGTGAEAVDDHALKALTGTGSVPLSFSADLPFLAITDTVEATATSGAVEITYTYYPSLRPRVSPDWWKHHPKYYPPAKAP